ncbi:MAG: class I SAM-dependent methyltransferase [Variovorax sp.]|nr:class I SAM-dependent methyltransferase [Variovorax sp.]
MSAFTADWLALREPFDRAARAAGMASFDLRRVGAALRRGQARLGVLDLACGTGANLRELAPRLGGPQHWVMVDHDPHLLAALPHAMADWASACALAMHAGGEHLRITGPDWSADVETRCLDLAALPDAALFDGPRLVTASALLDLVSAPWIDAWAGRARACGAALLFGLTVDGGVDWQPPLEDDESVQRLFAAHQGRDKGFGPALGGGAAHHAATRLAALGYEVVRCPSDWRIDGRAGPHAVDLLRALIEGTAAAAIQQAPAQTARVQAWAARRLERAGETRLRVGHCELLATLP